MSPQCPQPDLQVELLNDARDGETLAPEFALHLEDCPSCQAAIERQRRMASVWAEDEVDEATIAAAEDEFAARRSADRSKPAWLEIAPFATTGALAGYLLLAATGSIGVPWKPRVAASPLPRDVAPASAMAGANAPSVSAEESAHRSAPIFAMTEEEAKQVRVRPHIEAARGVAPLVDGLRLTLKRGESARIALGQGRDANVEGPCLIEFRSTPMEASGWKMIREALVEPATIDIPSVPPETSAASAASSERPSVAAPSGSSASLPSRSLADLVTAVGGGARDVGATREQAVPASNAVTERAWARAAAALREDDFEAADRAFDELGRASDAATRDAARLARAQLWISRGREAAVRPVLEQLAQSGATPLVRQRAAEFLNRDNR